MNARPTMMEAREPTMDPATGEVIVHQGGGGTQMAMSGAGWIMTAQPVARERNLAGIRKKIAEACAVYGETYVYSWSVKDRKTGGRAMIEGPTVKLANDIARIWGNNVTMIVRVDDEGESWVFHGAFIDLETGFNYVRPFRQRKSQSLGMPAAEREREIDIIFQVGASKAIRNAVVNALSGEIQFAVEQAKRALITWVEANKEKADTYITKMLDREEIDVKRIEGVLARSRAQWTVRDISRVIAELRGIEDGFTKADDLYPRLDIAQALTKGQEVERVKDQTDAKTKAEAKVAEGEKKTEQAAGGATKPEAAGGQEPEGQTGAATPGAGAGGGQQAPSTPAATGDLPLQETEEQKRGRGRPPGSKNKSKETQEQMPDMPKSLVREPAPPAAEAKKPNPADYDFE